MTAASVVVATQIWMTAVSVMVVTLMILAVAVLKQAHPVVITPVVQHWK